MISVGLSVSVFVVDLAEMYVLRGMLSEELVNREPAWEAHATSLQQGLNFDASIEPFFSSQSIEIVRQHLKVD